ncbi:BON domain-containing protein [Bdellovibrio bacteriovorus]|uniref:Putative pilus assembly transmembrane protein n=1 Tax=Bdellovibrio bacteriovorus str. Tiberius TaxID=1069642 RepID=K7YT89_BDEBC|nr:BON domain-containing protein [Bdellovibrio bacteriovorus]AFX99814.1 putative pilus assembly transmembrane protein [Bdellovibrio bacteriovorus str. Tiberius]
MRRKILITGLLSLFMISGSVAWAQEELEASPTSSTEGEEGVYRSRKFINLTLGIEQDEKLPPLPDSIEFKGDFRRIVTAAYAKDLNVMRFTPKGEGFATLTIHDKRNGKIVAEFRIDVKKSKLDKVVREMRALLGDIEGINIKIVNNRVVVDGQILLPKDLARIYNVVQQFGEQASSLVTLSPLAQKKIAEFIARDINNPEIEVRAVNEKIILQGWANSDEEAKRAEIIAKTYLPDIVIEAAEEKGVIKKRRPANDGVINLIQIKEAPAKPPSKMIQLVVHYVELNKDYSKAFKFQFTPELGDNSQMTFQTGGDSPGGVISSITGTVSNLLPKLNWAKQHGHARVLESTSLIVEDGKKGEIKQVTNQPYPVIGKDGTQGTAFAEVGIVTAITPVLLGEKSGSVHMEMAFKVSSLLGNTPSGAPITSANEMTSTVTVRDRQSAAVGGLIRNSTSTGYNRPAGQKNPIISLYASKDFIKQQSQFVVFVTPIVKTSASSGAEQIKKKFRLRD